MKNDYQDFLEKFKNIELSVTKNNSSFLQRLLEHVGYDFSHSDFKAIIRGKKDILSETEYAIKHSYDAYVFLLSNPNMLFSSSLLKRFFYILLGKEMIPEIITQLQAVYYNFGNEPVLEKILSTHFRAYALLADIDEPHRVAASFMILNYLLLKNKMVPLRFFARDFIRYEQIKDDYISGNAVPAVNFLIEKLSTERTQSKEYYKHLRPISTKDVMALLKENKETIQGLYKIRSLVLFGSFAKKTQNIESDIDLAVVFEEDISYEEKEQCAENLKEFLFLKAQRFVDIQEINPYMEEKFIAGFQKYIKVF